MSENNQIFLQQTTKKTYKSQCKKDSETKTEEDDLLETEDELVGINKDFIHNAPHLEEAEEPNPETASEDDDDDAGEGLYANLLQDLSKK